MNLTLKYSGVKNNKRHNEFLLLKENILSIQLVLLFLHAILHKHKKVSPFFIGYAIKVSEKYRKIQESNRCRSHYLIYPLLSVKEYWTSMNYHTFIIVSLVFSVCIKIHKTCNSMQIMIFNKPNCWLKMRKLVKRHELNSYA